MGELLQEAIVNAKTLITKSTRKQPLNGRMPANHSPNQNNATQTCCCERFRPMLTRLPDHWQQGQQGQSKGQKAQTTIQGQDSMETKQACPSDHDCSRTRRNGWLNSQQQG